jgi:DNA-binding transcriptional MerR regulator
MSAGQDVLWTIDELGAQVAVALSMDYQGSLNGRVRDVPDRRTIRYYTTIGLLDRPVEMRGRTALYARRHLLQLVAIKRLQACGLTLAEVQQRLLGLTDSALRSLAQLPDDLEAPRGEHTESAPSFGSAPDRGLSAFWSATPAAVRPPEALAPQEEGADSLQRPAPADVALQSIPLNETVHLALVASRPVYDEDVEAICAAAAPLLKLLELRRLLRPREEREDP